MNYTLIKVQIQKKYKKKPWIILDQSKKQVTLNQVVSTIPNQAILIEEDRFICIVPVYDMEYHFSVFKTPSGSGFTISDIINTIVMLTIGVYKMDIYLNPSHYRCDNNSQCAEDIANGYVLSKLYKKITAKHPIIWYDIDH